MVTYTLSSVTINKVESAFIRDLLNYKTVKELLFPCELILTEGKKLRLDVPDALELVLIPREFRHEHGMSFTLECKQNLVFNFNLSTSEYLASSFNITFFDKSLDYIYEHKDKFIDIMKYVSSRFPECYISVFDSERTKYVYDLKYFVTPNRGYYPLQIGWMCFFSSVLIDCIGEKYFKLAENYSTTNINGGILIISSEIPLPASNELYRKHDEDITKQLELRRFIK